MIIDKIDLMRMDQKVINKTLENQQKELEIEREAVEREKQRALHYRPLGLLQFPDSLV